MFEIKRFERNFLKMIFACTSVRNIACYFANQLAEVGNKFI